MRTLILALIMLVLAGCTTPSLWSRRGSTVEEFSQDRYTCLREATVPYSAGTVNPYFGTASSGMYADKMLFEACMGARGWILRSR